MITRQQIDALQQFPNGPYLVTSCYLNLDRTQMPAVMLKIRAKDLLQSARHQLEAKAGTHLQRESLRQDFERIEAHVLEDIGRGNQKALAVFACAGEKFWQTYRLPRLVRNLLIAAPAPYVRPLLALLGQYERYGAVVIDAGASQLFEVYMGAIVEHALLTGPVPRKIRDDGFGGRDERSNERRHDGAVQQHLQRVAEAAFGLFKQHQFDRLVLGGAREALAVLKQQLHPYLRQRWAGDFVAEAGRTTTAEVLAATMAIEERVAEERGQQLVEELLRQVEQGGRAVSGFAATVGAIARGEAQTVVVEEGLAGPGRICRPCRRVSLDEDLCAQCQQPTEPCADVVDEVVGLATATNCAVRYVGTETELHEAGRVGALLRY
jgi:peptide subunit release factor 1 (eRF1)